MDPAGVRPVELAEGVGIALLGAANGQVAHGAGGWAYVPEPGGKKRFGMHSDSTPEHP
jgi:hypothetical protein